MADNMTAAVIAGLAAGIGFIAVLFLVLNPPLSRFVTDVTPGEQSLTDRARQQEVVQLFLKKYPFAQEGIVNRDPFITYNENGDIASSRPAVTITYFPSSTKTIITYDDVKLNGLLIRYEYPSLWVVMSLDGNVEDVTFRCGISYLGNPSGMTGMVMGNDVVLRFLHAGKSPC